MKREKALYSVVVAAQAVQVLNENNKAIAEVRIVGLPEQLKEQAMMHGLKQKIGDAGAVQAGDNGKVDPQEKLRRVLAMVDRLNRGIWNERAVNGSGQDSVLVRALLLAYPNKTREVISAYVGDLNSDEKLALLAPKSVIAEYVEQVRAELAKDIDTNGLMEKLEALS